MRTELAVILLGFGVAAWWIWELCHWLGKPINPDEKNDDGFI